MEHGDHLNGTVADDVILGAAGDDKLTGNKGNDYLDGGKGDDRVSGGNGNLPRLPIAPVWRVYERGTVPLRSG